MGNIDSYGVDDGDYLLDLYDLKAKNVANSKGHQIINFFDLFLGKEPLNEFYFPKELENLQSGTDFVE